MFLGTKLKPKSGDGRTFKITDCDHEEAQGAFALMGGTKEPERHETPS